MIAVLCLVVHLALAVRPTPSFLPAFLGAGPADADESNVSRSFDIWEWIPAGKDRLAGPKGFGLRVRINQSGSAASTTEEIRDLRGEFEGVNFETRFSLQDQNTVRVTVRTSSNSNTYESIEVGIYWEDYEGTAYNERGTDQ
jgi:hypothetical protein